MTLYSKDVHLLGTGEEVGEGHGYSQAQCEAIDCCEWDDDECWSSVGKNPCDSGTYRKCHSNDDVICAPAKFALPNDVITIYEQSICVIVEQHTQVELSFAQLCSDFLSIRASLSITENCNANSLVWQHRTDDSLVLF